MLKMTIYCVNLKKNGYCARNNTCFCRDQTKRRPKDVRFERLIIYLFWFYAGYLIKGEMGINAQKRQYLKIVAREIRARLAAPAKAV